MKVRRRTPALNNTSHATRGTCRQERTGVIDRTDNFASEHLAESISSFKLRPEGLDAIRTDFELAQHFRRLQDEGYDAETISKSLGYKSSRLAYKLEAFSKLPLSFMNLIRKNLEFFTADIADVLLSAVNSLGEEVAYAIAEDAVASRHSYHKITAIIRAAKRSQLRDSVGNNVITNTVVRLNNRIIGNVSVSTVFRSGFNTVQVNVRLPEEAAKSVANKLHECIQKSLSALKESGEIEI
jgi:hypothetical protein